MLWCGMIWHGMARRVVPVYMRPQASSNVPLRYPYREGKYDSNLDHLWSGSNNSRLVGLAALHVRVDWG